MAVNITQGGLDFNATIHIEDFQRQINRMEASLVQLTQTANHQSSAIENFAQKTAGAIAAYTSFAGASNFIQDMVQVRGQFEQLETSFRVMLKSKSEADKLLQEVTQFAASTPFELSDVAGATKTLLAMGVSADKVKSSLQSIGDIASGVGAPLNELAYLFGQIKTQGVAMTQDVRQFASRGIPIYEELSKILGVSTDEVNKFITAGKVGFPEIEKVFQNLTSTSGQFAGLSEAQSKTILGQISNIRDSFAQMLNDLGKSNEGFINTVLSGTKNAVDHYQDIIKGLEVIAITYGSYKAAVVATTLATNGLTAAETLHFYWLELTRKAQLLLNRTMLANPYAAVAAAVAAIVASLALFSHKATEVKGKVELLADAQKKAADSFNEQEAKIRSYVEVLKTGNTTEEQRLSIYNRLKEIDPQIVKGIDAKTLSYQKLTANVNLYLESLRRQLAIEANESAVKSSILQEQNITARIKEQQKVLNSFNAAGAEASRNQFINIQASQKLQQDGVKRNIELLQQQLKEQQKVTTDLANEGSSLTTTNQPAPVTKPRTVEVIEAEIKALKEKRDATATTIQQYHEYNQQIKLLEEERQRITGATTQQLKQQQSAENRINELLDQRKGLLEEIAGIERDARQTGLVKESSAIDAVNQKYDQAIQKITDFNNKVAEYNKRNHTKVNGIGQVDINKLNEARSYEINNTLALQDAESFKKSLEAQKDLFARYEEAKVKIGAEKANQLYSEQTKGYESYLAYLKQEATRIAPKLVLGIANVGDIQKFKTVTKELEEARKKQGEEELQHYVELFTTTATYTDKKAALDRKYTGLYALLSQQRSKITEEEYDNRLKLLQESQQVEENEIKNAALRQSAIYKKMGADLISYSRGNIKSLIDSLQSDLKTGFTTDQQGNPLALTPQMRKDLEDYLEQLKQFYHETGDIFGTSVKQLEKIAQKAQEVSQIFATLGDALSPLSDNLGGALSQISQMAAVAGNVASGIAQLETNPLAAAQSFASAIAGIVSVFAKAKQSAKEAQEQLARFQQAILQGEIETNIQYRERLRSQEQLNKLKLQGIADENKLLADQRNANEEDYKRILQQLQNEQFIQDEKAKKGKGSLLFGLVGYFTGLGAQTSVQQQLASLAGKSYEDLEKLFNNNQLTDKAKELFLQLQKLKSEGADIDKELQDLQQEAAAIFTGTTADSLRDSLAQMFREGKTSAQDFADFFEKAMKDAALSSFEYKFLEPKIQDFFSQFSAAAQSDGVVTATEISQLQSKFNAYMKDAQKEFQQLQQITGLNFGSGSLSSAANSLQGAIKGITEETGTVLAGSVNGIRLDMKQQLQISMESLRAHQAIEQNTSQTVTKLAYMIDRLEYYYSVQGVKIK